MSDTGCQKVKHKVRYRNFQVVYKMGYETMVSNLRLNIGKNV